MKTPKKDSRTTATALDRKPRGQLKQLGGSSADEWNMRLARLVERALPIDQTNSEENKKASTAVFAAMVDLAPTDPLDGILVAQLMRERGSAFDVSPGLGAAAGVFHGSD